MKIPKIITLEQRIVGVKIMMIVFFITIFGMMLMFIIFINQIIYDTIDLVYWLAVFITDIFVIIIAKKILDELEFRNKHMKQLK